MVNYSEIVIDHIFAALAHSTRRAILQRLLRGPATVGMLATDFTISLPAISKHLDVLEAAQLLVREKHGRERLCQLQPQGLQEATRWLERYRPFWEERLDALDGYLREQTADEPITQVL